MKISKLLVTSVLAFGLSFATAGAQENIPIIDAHIHYSHDAWSGLPPADAIKVLRNAGLKKAFVSSSSDAGTQMLYDLAPDLIVPVLRPYRQRGETGSWLRDASVMTMVEDLLAKNTYAGIGEFHAFGADADLPVVRRMVELAAEYKIFLHAHADAEAIDRIFAQNPDARVLWAHSGFVDPEDVAAQLRKYANLRADLAFRDVQGASAKVSPAWRKVFLEFPDRFVLGTDTYTPGRWSFVNENAAIARQWLSDLPKDVGQNIAYRNAEALAAWALQD